MTSTRSARQLGDLTAADDRIKMHLVCENGHPIAILGNHSENWPKRCPHPECRTPVSPVGKSK